MKIYFFYFIVFIFILLKYIGKSFFILKNNFCNWDINYATMTYDINRKYECHKVLNFLKDLNITYFLGEGSALGAYRNHGVILKDHDYDIIIPIWMNSHIFNCKEYYTINRTDKNMEYFLASNHKLCNNSRKIFYDILNNYITSNSNYKHLKMVCRKWNVFNYTSCLISFETTEIDMWVILGNEYSYSTIDICRCEYCNYYSYCLKITPTIVRNMYGNDYYIYKERNKGGNNIMKRIIIY